MKKHSDSKVSDKSDNLVEGLEADTKRPYQAPQITSGDIFERVVVQSGAGPTALECSSEE